MPQYPHEVVGDHTLEQVTQNDLRALDELLDHADLSGRGGG